MIIQNDTDFLNGVSQLYDIVSKQDSLGSALRIYMNTRPKYINIELDIVEFMSKFYPKPLTKSLPFNSIHKEFEQYIKKENEGYVLSSRRFKELLQSINYVVNMKAGIKYIS